MQVLAMIHPRADDTVNACAYISRMGDASASGPRSLDQAVRWIRRLGVVVIAVVLGLSIAQAPAPAFTGQGLGVTLSLIVLLGSAVWSLGHTAPAGLLGSLSAMVLSSAALVWLQRSGAGVAGLFVAVTIAAMRLPPRPSAGIAALAMITFTAAALHAHRAAPLIVANELGIAAFYLVARLARSATEAHEETRRLLLELEATRQAEAEAAMLRERSRLARDMHDVLAHSLSGLMLQLEGARMLAAQPDANGQLPPALDRAHHLARAGLEEARRAIAALRDEDLPGPNRLEQLTADFQHDSNILTSLTISGKQRPIDSESALTIYRVAQEALTNIRKHANPQRVELHLRYDPDGIRLAIDDRTDRPSPSEDPSRLGGGGYGLTGMRERAALLGGTLEAGRTADGFGVELWIPA
jgi:signal transduction histidine kinase